MKLIVDVPHSLYANLSTIKNESVAGKRILECVKNGTPIKIGHWIDKFGGVYRCSCCREIISIDTEIEFPNGITYKYCPNCGAKMQEESEDKR